MYYDVAQTNKDRKESNPNIEDVTVCPGTYQGNFFQFFHRGAFLKKSFLSDIL